MEQSDYPLLTKALQTIIDQSTRFSNVPAVHGMQQINNTLGQIQQGFQNLPTLEKVNESLADITTTREEQKLFNCGFRPEGNLKYPAGIVLAPVNGLPETYPFVRQSKKGDILGPRRRDDIQKI